MGRRGKKRTRHQMRVLLLFSRRRRPPLVILLLMHLSFVYREDSENRLRGRRGREEEKKRLKCGRERGVNSLWTRFYVSNLEIFWNQMFSGPHRIASHREGVEGRAEDSPDDTYQRMRDALNGVLFQRNIPCLPACSSSFSSPPPSSPMGRKQNWTKLWS